MPKPIFTKRLPFLKRKEEQTFSDWDIIRIACLNLNREELRNVILFFMIGVPAILASEQALLFLFGARIPKTQAQAIFKIVKFFIALKLIKLLNIFAFVFDEPELKVFKKIVKRLHKLFPR